MGVCGAARSHSLFRKKGSATISPEKQDCNNPFVAKAHEYDRNLERFPIGLIRRQEAQAVRRLIEQYARPGTKALEIGAGTGFYTLQLASQCEHVTVVEHSDSMSQILQARLTEAKVTNVDVVVGDFLSTPLPGPFDLVVSIGVLDYVADGRTFVHKACELAERAVLLTTPRRGLLGTCFHVGSKLHGTSIYRYDPASFNELSPVPCTTVVETGLRTRFTKGLTLVIAIETNNLSDAGGSAARSAYS